MCFSREGFLFNEFDQIFSNIFLTRSDLYKKIIMALTDRYLEPNVLCKTIGVELNSTVSDYLEELGYSKILKYEILVPLAIYLSRNHRLISLNAAHHLLQ